jgi:hypothetical protein
MKLGNPIYILIHNRLVYDLLDIIERACPATNAVHHWPNGPWNYNRRGSLERLASLIKDAYDTR